MEKRIEWIDIAKGFGIMMVVLGHYILSETGPLYEIKSLIYAFHMPLFFICSGYLFNTQVSHGDFIPFVHKRCGSLLIPYISYSLLLSAFEIGVSLLKREPPHIGDRVVGMIVQVRGLNYSGTHWFITWMFVTQILMFVILLISRKKIVNIALVIILFCIGSHLEKINCKLPWHLDAALVAILFLEVGILLRQFENEKGISFTKNKEVLVLGIVLLLFCICYKLNDNILNGERIDIYDTRIGNPIMYVLLGTFGSYVLIYVSRKLQKIKIGEKIALLGRHFLAIYAMHKIIGSLIYQGEKAVGLVGKNMGVECLRVTISFMFGILLCVVFALLAQRCCPVWFGYKARTK